MHHTRTLVRALAGACALTLLLAACSDDDEPSARTVDDDTEQTTTTAADEQDDDPTSTAADEPDGSTTTTAAEEPDDSGDGSGDGTEGDPDAVALAERINLTIDDFADGWTETPAEDDDGGANLDDCFVETDIEAATVGEAETGTFSLDVDDTSGQLVTMQTVVLDSADTATALLAEAGGDAFITCAQDLFVSGFGEGAAVALSVRPDDEPWTEESFGLVGDITLPTQDGSSTVDGVMDLHLFRTGEVVSFTATLDLGLVGIEATLGELYPVVAERHAAEVG